MIPHADFARLRLEQFAPKSEIVPLENWEFMGERWVGEAIALSEWLRLERSPQTLGSLALDFNELPSRISQSVLKSIGLPLRPGMTAEELWAVLGRPAKVETFVDDRKSYEFVHGKQERYRIFATVLNAGGLSYLVVMTQPRKR